MHHLYKTGLLSRLPIPTQATKRKAFFSFHYDDIMRVNAVRNAWRFQNPSSLLVPSFYDSSLWESKKLEGDDAIKRLIREGVEYTSAVCVLVGTETWRRRWVKYEISRSVIDKRGVLAVHLNSINHHRTGFPDQLGFNPLHLLAVGKVQNPFMSTAQYYFFERTTNGWERYSDYSLPVSLPGYLRDPSPGYVTPLSSGTMEYDFMKQNGHKNIGGWLDLAAQMVGR